ncbi:hypothetical protein [Dokdonia sp.]|uniref:hypothetical protein n=1 Tax=Dokdonia sp. TaxID=2024995 RepID=UPI003267AD47
MYKKISLLLILCISFLSCSDPIENNSRIAFELKVIDDANQPISDIVVNASVHRGAAGIIFFPVIPSFDGILGVGSTNDQGTLTLISLEPDQTVDQIGVLINSDEQFSGNSLNEDYGVVIYQLDSLLTKTTILPDVVLKRSASLEIAITDVPTMDGTLEYTITYATRLQQFQFPNGEESVINTIEGSGALNSSGMPITLETLQNTTAIFSYELTTGGETETNTIEIPINQETVQYAFEF